MRRFAIFYTEGKEIKRAILALVKGYNEQDNSYYYSFVNLTEDSILPERYANVETALKYLDKLEEAGMQYIDVTKKYIY